MITPYNKAPSVDVEKFLGAMKKPSSPEDQEKVASLSLQEQKDLRIFFTPSYEVPASYEHGKAFLYIWDL
jgi:hypothetical protein